AGLDICARTDRDRVARVGGVDGRLDARIGTARLTDVERRCLCCRRDEQRAAGERENGDPACEVQVATTEAWLEHECPLPCRTYSAPRRSGDPNPPITLKGDRSLVEAKSLDLGLSRNAELGAQRHLLHRPHPAAALGRGGAGARRGRTEDPRSRDAPLVHTG